MSLQMKQVAGVVGFLVALGTLITLWDDLRPWPTRDIELRVCKNALDILQTNLFRAQQNGFEAQLRDNKELVFQSKQAQEVYKEQIAREKKACGL